MMLSEAQKVADVIVDPEGTDNCRDHWKLKSFQLLALLLLNESYKHEGTPDQERILSEVAKYFSLSHSAMQLYLKGIVVTKHLGENAYPGIVAMANDVLKLPYTEFSSVVLFSNSLLKQYMN